MRCSAAAPQRWAVQPPDERARVGGSPGHDRGQLSVERSSGLLARERWTPVQRPDPRTAPGVDSGVPFAVPAAARAGAAGDAPVATAFGRVTTRRLSPFQGTPRRLRPESRQITVGVDTACVETFAGRSGNSRHRTQRSRHRRRGNRSGRGRDGGRRNRRGRHRRRHRHRRRRDRTRSGSRRWPTKPTQSPPASPPTRWASSGQGTSTPSRCRCRSGGKRWSGL